MAARADRLEAFYRRYERYTEEALKPTRRELRDLLRQWARPGYWDPTVHYDRPGMDGLRPASANLPAPSPLVRPPFVRIKRPESVADKINRRRDVFRAGLRPASFKQMHDTVGARVIVFFLSQLPLIDHEIRNRRELELNPSDPPVAYLPDRMCEELGLSHLTSEVKASGYSSVHYIARLTESSVPEKKRPWFEIQVRTAAEDLWASVEHQLGYKPERQTAFAVTEQFGIISNHVLAIDHHLNFIHRELRRFQGEPSYKQTSALNAENLPAVLSSRGIGCAQRDIDFLLRVLRSNGIKRVRDLLSVATPDRLELIRNTVQNYIGREATDIHVVALLAVIRGAKTNKERIARIQVQLDAKRWFDDLLKEFG